MKCLAFVFILLSLAIHGAAAQKLYKYQDKEGVWHFADTPPKGGNKVAVRQLKVAPRQMVRLIQSGEDRKPAYAVRNDYAGPVEVEIDFAEAANARATPELPVRTGIAPGVSDPLFETAAVDGSQPWSYTLKLRYVPGRPMANYRSEALYFPPIEPNASFRITQAFDGAFSHRDDQNRYAVDIAMPVGTPVHAARAGVVIAVEDDFFRGGTDQAYRDEANSIRILHGDGSMAVYAHLELEKTQVHSGLRVEAGQLIGYSGNTGFTSGPHLHFAVQYNRGMKLVSAPFAFRTPSGRVREPAAGDWLEGVATME
ncbi:MAG: peptidoglycan DD-metalloendopeptidase family protein [Gammaproteobacteria bacterium]